MDLALNNKVAIVTGSSQGIGFAIAKMLLDEGCKIVINGRNKSKLDTAKEKLSKSVLAYEADVSVFSDCEKLVKKTIDTFGRLDILICNAGFSKSVKPGDENTTEWQNMLSANLLTATNMIQCATPYLSKTKGCITCISSICGVQTIQNAPVTYSASKAALNAAVKGLAIPLAQCGVRINAIAPGNILFPGSVWDKKMQISAESVDSMLKKNIPLQRFGTVEDIANMAAYLASNKSAFMTGSIVVIDGGQTVKNS